MTIDWSIAPEWANYHAFDNDGGAFWHAYKPKRVKSAGCWISTGMAFPSGLRKPDNVKWEKSVTERPKVK
jgi:hypothetical protein